MKIFINKYRGKFRLYCAEGDEEEFIIFVNKLRKAFTVKNPKAHFSDFADDEITCISPMGAFPIGMSMDIIRKIKQIDSSIIIDTSRVLSTIVPFSYKGEIETPENDKFVYRDYQESAIKIGLICGRGTYDFATSAGKSLIIYGLIKNLSLHMNNGSDAKFLVLVPNIGLVVQMSKDFIDYGCDPDIICQFTANRQREVSSNAKIIVTNTQWIAKHKDELPNIDVIMVDEVQCLGSGRGTLKQKNKTYCFVDDIPTQIRFGFTGTIPNYEPSKWNIKGAIGPILKIKRAHSLQSEGYIAKCKIVSFKFVHKDKPKISKELTDMMREAEKESDPKVRKQMMGIVKLEIAKSRYPTEWKFIESCEYTNRFMIKFMANMPGNTIILFDHIEHGNRLFKYLSDITDKRIFLINGSVPLDEREDVRESMELNNNCITLGNTKCIAVGTNIKNIDNVAFVFSSGQAATKVIQAIGRGLRLKDGKTHVNIFDFYHDMRYSSDHYIRRLRLYLEHYNIDKDKIITKTVYVKGNAEIMNI